jgi:hypothetical protein
MLIPSIELRTSGPTDIFLCDVVYEWFCDTLSVNNAQ